MKRLAIIFIFILIIAFTVYRGKLFIDEYNSATGIQIKYARLSIKSINKTGIILQLQLNFMNNGNSDVELGKSVNDVYVSGNKLGVATAQNIGMIRNRTSKLVDFEFSADHLNIIDTATGIAASNNIPNFELQGHVVFISKALFGYQFTDTYSLHSNDIKL